MSTLRFYGFLDKTIPSGIVRLVHNELKDLYPLYLRQDSQHNGLEPWGSLHCESQLSPLKGVAKATK